MEHYWKQMSTNDTIKIAQSCYFKKTDSGTIVPFVFNAKTTVNREELFPINSLYNGEQVVLYPTDGSKPGSIYIQQDIQWNVLVKNAIFNSYLPIAYSDSRPITSDILSDSDEVSIRFIKEVEVNGFECYHIQARVPPAYDHSLLVNYDKVVKTEFNYWINKHDSIPIQITIERDLKVGSEQLVEFEKYVLNKYELDKNIDNALFTMQSIPKDIDLQYIEPTLTEASLEAGDIAPDWNLGSSNGEMITLSDYRGKLVLIDFFFAGCPPCIEVLPSLDSLYQKYRDRGLQMIGISYVDTRKTLEYFKERHGINYPLLKGGIDVKIAYNVSHFPAFFLIDKNGEILFHQRFNHQTIEKLENIINQHVN